MLTATLFGELGVAIDGRPLPPIAGLKPRALLAYLLLVPGRRQRVALAGRFWPDVLDTSARASLRSALWTVRGLAPSAIASAELDHDSPSARKASTAACSSSTGRDSTTTVRARRGASENPRFVAVTVWYSPFAIVPSKEPAVSTV